MNFDTFRATDELAQKFRLLKIESITKLAREHRKLSSNDICLIKIQIFFYTHVQSTITEDFDRLP